MNICAILKILFDSKWSILYLILTLELRISHSLTPIKNFKDLQNFFKKFLKKSKKCRNFLKNLNRFLKVRIFALPSIPFHSESSV